MTNKRRYSPEFRLEAAQLVVDQGYTLKAAYDAMGIANPPWSTRFAGSARNEQAADQKAKR